MQTWEYAPQFALRTYTYLYPLLGVSKLYTFLLPTIPLASMLVGREVTHDRMALFILLRATLAGVMGLAEVNFLTAISEQVPFHRSLTHQPLVSREVSYATGFMLLTSAGMAHASGALLPSSSFLLAWLLSASCYTRQQVTPFILIAVTATLAIGWPFGVVCLIPMGVHILWTSERPIKLLLVTLMYSIVVQATVMCIDFTHYGRWTSATYNIFRYNARGGGDELYGVEPISYYIKNALLNINYMAGLSLIVLPVCFYRRNLGSPLPTPLVTLTASLYFWLAIVVPRPHKEERFLFPIYAIAILSAVVVLEQLWLSVKGRRTIWFLALLPSSMIGVSRTMALAKYYTSPLDVYAAIPSTATGSVCTCGEWYRFPSSFMLPPETRLAFSKSSFTGQLPKPFEAEGSRAGTNFNDANREEQDRYVNVKECAYVVEMDEVGASCVVAMEQSHTVWTKIVSHQYLDAEHTSILHRILYLPFLHERFGSVMYHSYSLYKQEANKIW
jgi:alpha-1,2-mannosyltransferase